MLSAQGKRGMQIACLWAQRRNITAHNVLGAQTSAHGVTLQAPLPAYVWN